MKLMNKTIKYRYKFVALFVIISMLCTSIPVTAVNPIGNITSEAFENSLLEPLDSSEVHDPIIDHLRTKIPNLNIAHLNKFYKEVLFNHRLLASALGDNDPGEFYAAYLSNSNQKFIFHGEQLTAKQAASVNRAIGTQLVEVQKCEDELSKLSEFEQLKYIYHEYPNIESIDRALRDWNNVAKYNFVLSTIKLDQDTLKDHPNGVSTKTAWNNYATKANNTINQYALDFWLAGQLFDDKYGANGGDENYLKTSYLVNNIMTLNETASNIDRTRYDLICGRYAVESIGWFCVFLGLLLMGKGLYDVKVGNRQGTGDQLAPSDEQTKIPEKVPFDSGTVIDSEGRPLLEVEAQYDSQGRRILPYNTNRVHRTTDDARVVVSVNDIDPVQAGFKDRQSMVNHLIKNGEVLTDIDGKVITSESGSGSGSTVQFNDFFKKGNTQSLIDAGRVKVVCESESGILFSMDVEAIPSESTPGAIALKFNSGPYSAINGYPQLIMTEYFIPNGRILSPRINIMKIDGVGLTMRRPPSQPIIDLTSNNRNSWLNIKNSVKNNSNETIDPIPNGSMTFEEINKSMGENDCLIVYKTGESGRLIINKEGMDQLDEVDLKGTDYFSEHLVYDSPFTDYGYCAGFIPHELDEKVTIISSAFTSLGSIVGTGIIMKAITKWPIVGWTLFTIGALVFAVGVILVSIGETFRQIIKSLDGIITNILKLLQQLLGFYNWLYTDYQH